MLKGKPNQALTQNPMVGASIKKDSWWRKCLNVFHRHKKQNLVPSLPIVSNQEADLFQLDDFKSKSNHGSFLEIAIINAEGNLEIIHLPQEVFTVRVETENDPNSNREETIVILELKDMLGSDENKEEDPNARITHFPPNDRLH